MGSYNGPRWPWPGVGIDSYGANSCYQFVKDRERGSRGHGLGAGFCSYDGVGRGSGKPRSYGWCNFDGEGDG